MNFITKITSLIWICSFIIISVIFGTIYAVIQQNSRLSANDEQVKIAYDISNSIENGSDINSLVSTNKIDISKSLSPFIIIYDDEKNVISSSGLLNNEIPQLPKGVLDYTLLHNENRVTWQPQNNVRIAAVVKKFESGNMSGYVLVGKSLKEVEDRDSHMFLLVLVAWFISMVFISFILLISKSILNSKEKIQNE